MDVLLRAPNYAELLDRGSEPSGPPLADPRTEEPEGMTWSEQRRTGFEPFILGSLAGLGLWALLLSPFLL